MERADDRKRHIRLLLRCVEVSIRARASGNRPFGALLADAHGRVLLEQGNVEVTERMCTGHAEAVLAAEASRRYPKARLRECTLYSTAEPCAMCAGAIYWSGIGRVVYGISERRLAELTGGDERNPTLDLPCRTVFAAGRRPIEVLGPFPEVEAETVAVHAGYWS
ncbi:MAG: tRNA-specific adenosine deaminase [Thermobacillus sp. ZCTH02-B1]|uniref:nucleoside deaminase n=1 Tax=Thermobacillus sp. ZCTH02-B1 TaxID=1858795 RepID=UPI000B55A486|nr:nucleoside deaminase [Thermobacillus sp. ZCTH02-B1]OUM96598.1 MAG: tRNA-specific adenosine deaminase [Thermobacillus sp. ZCTH02-B1]